MKSQAGPEKKYVFKRYVQFRKKVIVMFGGNGHLGRQFCKAILDSGGKLYSCDTNINETDEIKQLKKEYPQQFNLIKVDSTKTKELEIIYRKIVTEEKKVDVLINATTMKNDDFYLPFEEVSLDSWNIRYFRKPNNSIPYHPDFYSNNEGK